MATQTQTILQQPVIPAVVAMDPHPPLAADRDALGLRSLSGDDDTSATGGECDRIPEESASRLQKVVVVFQLSGVNFSLSAVNGLIIVGLPRIAEDLALPPSLTFWPASVSSLATSATLLLAGSVADALGPRAVDLTGCFLCGAFMLGCGLAKEGEQLVGMRAVTGVGQAMHLASSVALVTKIVARGRGRNVSFACLGLSQPLGFSFGLVLGGVLVDTIGWRAGFYIYGGLTVLLSAIGCVSLPKSEPLGSLRDLSHLIRRKVDWVGALLASSFMAFLSYFLAVISGDMYRIREPGSIVFLCLGVMSLPFFVAWVHRQVRRGRPALIPNSFWRNASFASICATISVTFAVLNSLELFASLFFQEIQHLSALQAALRILPSLVVGVILNFSTGLLVHKIPAMWIVVVSSILTAGAPLLMAVVQPEWTYWANAFLAQILMPISADVLFTVGLIVITDVFPEDKQAVAGAVFNTGAQFGNAFGLAVMQVISTLVSKEHHGGDGGMGSARALMQGYRACFWTMFAMMLSCAVIGAVGLRKTGKIGLKTD